MDRNSNSFVSAVHWRHQGLRLRDEYEKTGEHFSFHFLILASRRVRQLRTWHLWGQINQLSTRTDGFKSEVNLKLDIWLLVIVLSRRSTDITKLLDPSFAVDVLMLFQAFQLLAWSYLMPFQALQLRSVVVCLFCGVSPLSLLYRRWNACNWVKVWWRTWQVFHCFLSDDVLSYVSSVLWVFEKNEIECIFIKTGRQNVPVDFWIHFAAIKCYS